MAFSEIDGVDGAVAHGSHSIVSFVFQNIAGSGRDVGARDVSAVLCLDGKQDNAQVYVNLAKKYIDEHYAEEISLQTIADLAHVNAAYLSSVFKKTTGINYLTYLTEVRMEKAKELLCQLDMNLSQIANAVGYTSTRYFSKTFENEVGMKPSEYRRVYLREQR